MSEACHETALTAACEDDAMRVPDLGRRGQGWVFLQLILTAAIALAGVPPSGVTGLPATVLVVIGGALIVAGGVMAFLGVQTLGRSFTPNPRPLEASELVETGIYRSVRHPIYGGLVLGALGWGVLNASIASVVLSGLLLCVLYLKSIREEAWLTDRYPAYPAYRDRTRRFFPGLI
jgi:protein-S-isoprenylcysteine O-methyltransferase Ste14